MEVIEKFVKGFGKKYVITSEGILYSNYHYSPGLYKKRIDEIKIMNPVSKSKKPPNVILRDDHGEWSNTWGKSQRFCFIIDLVIEAFELVPPDLNYFKYEQAFRNNNPHDCSVANVYWKDVSYRVDYDNILLDDRHEPVAKICPCCKEFLHINNFCTDKKTSSNYYRLCHRCSNLSDAAYKRAIKLELKIDELEDSEELNNLIELKRKKSVLWRKLRRAELTQSDNSVKK